MQAADVLQRIAQILTTSKSKNSDQLVNYQSIEKLERTLDLDKLSPENWEQIFIWASQYLEYSPDTSHPNFANRMWSGANLPSVVGEVITALRNSSGCTFESAPVATLMEKYMLRQMLEIVGFKHGEGQMTTGSSNGNMIAMMVARNQILQNVKKKGLFGQKPLFVLVSADAHYSLDKAVNVLGIGTEHLIKIPTLDNGQMSISALETSIENIGQQGGEVFFVCATLGTTVRGTYDNISDLLKLKSKHNFWLHGDGAWGGAAIMSSKLKRTFLTNIENLDSFTMDFHKMLGSNLICNFLLLNTQDLLVRTCADGDNSYIFRDSKTDLGIASVQCGRRVDSLKWFLDWKFYTREGFSKRVEGYYQLAKFAEDFVNQNEDLEMLVPRSSFNVCFRFRVENTDKNAFNQRLRDNLYKQQQALLSLAYINENLVFRLLISNVRLTKAKLIALFERLIKTGRELNNG